jgi:hypothetical protein
MQIKDILDDDMVTDILGHEIELNIISNEHTLQVSKRMEELQSSNGMLDELGSPDLEDFELQKNYEEKEDSPLF